MYNEKMTISLKEGIHIPLEMCNNCPFFNSCTMSGSAHMVEKNKKMERLYLRKDLVSEVISYHFKIPKLPVYFYDTPHTMYETLGFFWTQLNYDNNRNRLMQSMYYNPIIILNSKNGIILLQVHENVINEMF